jgi:hypothetical protein
MAALITYKGFSCQMCPAACLRGTRLECTINPPASNVTDASWPSVGGKDKCWKGYELSKKAPQ